MKRWIAVLICAGAFWQGIFASGPAAAAAKDAKEAKGKPAAKSEAAASKKQKSVTHGSVTIDGKRIAYTATAGTIVLKNADGKPTGSMFYVAYVKDGVRHPSSRPITFLYNGGPGSSSVWLLMGGFGPERVVSGDAQHTPPAPFDVVNNQYSLLDVSDLVFVDAMGTGFSRIIDKAHGGVGTPKDFYGVDADGKAFDRFIYDYLSRNDRWNSPKYLLGESYGTTRSAVLANDLESHGIELNGVMLLSSILTFETASFNTGNDLPYVLYLPSYAAVACYHKVVKCPADLSGYLGEVESFARGEYASALMRGDQLSATRRAAVIAKLAQYTGLSAGYLGKADLRVSLPQFMAELQRNRGLVTGRLDGRYSGAAADELAEFAMNDPQSDAITGAYTAAFNRYVRQTLKFGRDRHYVILSYAVNRAWDWKHRLGSGFGWPGSTNVAPDLANAMRTNPHLRVEIENGYYDLATPYYATEYTVDHMGLPPNLRAHIQLEFYHCGHMLYEHMPSLAELRTHLVHFYERTDRENAGG